MKLRTATVQVFITVIRCSNYDSRPLAPVGRQHTPSFFEKDNTNPVEMHHANEFTAGRVIRPMFHRHLTHLRNTPKAEPISVTNKNMPPALCRTTFAQNSPRHAASSSSSSSSTTTSSATTSLALRLLKQVLARSNTSSTANYTRLPDGRQPVARRHRRGPVPPQHPLCHHITTENLHRTYLRAAPSFSPAASASSCETL